ncbi:MULTISPECIES: hypothetical protein [Streptomyces]|uniref:hypothetical protein n=1 Tax=Streptomyces TaxID=1883 RepID=UPI00192E4F54|nr:hypothetical protein [Streptomyces adustus]
MRVTENRSATSFLPQPQTAPVVDGGGTDIGTLADQLGTAARNFSMAGINGHEDVESAAAFLHAAHQATDATERDVFLRKADKLLRPIVWDMTQEYRDMVGD